MTQDLEFLSRTYLRLRRLVNSVELLVLLESDLDLSLAAHILSLFLLVVLHELECLLEARECYLLNELLDLGNLPLLRGLRVANLLVRVHAGQLVLEVLDEAGILLEHSELDDVVKDILTIDQAKELLALDANGLQLRHDLLRGLSLDFALFVVGEDERLKEEPNSVREEHVGLGSVQNQCYYVFGVFEASFDVNAAYLWYVKLQVIPEWRVEVRIYSALLQLSHSVLLVRVQLQEPANRIIRRQIQEMLLPNIDPLLKSLYKAHPCDLEALLATTAAAEEVIAWTKYSEAAAGAFLVLSRYEYLVEVVVVEWVREALRIGQAPAEVPRVHQDALKLAATLAGPHHGEVRLAGQRSHAHLLHTWRSFPLHYLLLLCLHALNVSVVAD